MNEALPGENYQAGIAYIALPTDIERQDYVNLCMRTFTVCLRAEDGAFFTRIPIGADDINLIEFPETPEKLGSAVVYITEPIKNQLIIVKVLNGEDIQDLQEGQFKTKKRWGNDYVEISGSAKNRYVGITVNTEDKGEFYVTVTNKNRTARLRLEVAGDASITAYNDVNLTGYNKIVVTTPSSDSEDETSTLELKPGQVTQTAKKTVINNGDQAQVKGDELKSIMEEFLDAVVGMKVTTTQGDAPVSAADIGKFQQIRAKFKNYLSTKSFLE